MKILCFEELKELRYSLSHCNSLVRYSGQALGGIQPFSTENEDRQCNELLSTWSILLPAGTEAWLQG